MVLELEENQKCLGDEGLLEDLSCKEMTCRVLVSTEPDSVRAWMVCAGAFIGNFIALGTIYSFGVLLVPITLDFKVGRGAAAWIGSVCAASMLFFAIFAGYLCQRFGYSQVAWAGGLTVAVFQIVSSFMPNIYGMFVTYGLLTGIGFSCCFMPGSAATSQWFEKYRGLGVGMAVAGSGVGNLVFPLIIETLLLELADWRSVMRCLAMFDLFFMIICGFLLENRFPLVDSKTDLSYLRPIFKDRAAWLICAYNAIMNIGFLVPSVHIVAAAEDQGVSSIESSLLLSLLGLSSTVGRVLFGWLSDRIGRKYTLVFSSFTMGISTCTWPGLALVGFPGFALYISVFGLVSGSLIAILLPIIADFFGVKYLPVLSGIVFASSAFGGLIGPPLAGFLFDITNSYMVSAIVAGGIMIAASCLTIFLPQDGTHTFEGYEVISELSISPSDSDSDSEHSVQKVMPLSPRLGMKE